MFVEEVNPENPNELKWNGGWEPVAVVTETIAVRGEAPRTITIKIGRHGPIFYEDLEHHRAYALRSSLQEQGTAEYLGGLRLNQATSARDCLAAADYMRSPPTNLVCADADGNIAFRVSAAAPKRRGWDGRLPVPGTGRYDWEGLRTDLPEEYNPARGFIATANNNIHPPGFENPLFFDGRYPYWRWRRITALLTEARDAGRTLTTEDMRAMLLDSFKEEADQLRPWFEGWTADDPAVERARADVAVWDAVMRKDSTAAAIFMTWRRRVDPEALGALAPPARRQAVERALGEAVADLGRAQGADPAQWRWGRMHRSVFAHPLVAAYDLRAVERDGGADTVNATGGVYRLITDFADPDRSLVTIAPGVSGQPGSPFYDNLLDLWARGEFFPLAFTRAAVEEVTAHRLVLTPAGQ